MRRLLVLNAGEGTVSVVDPEPFREVRRVDLDRMAGTRRGAYLSPRELFVNQERSRVYILCSFDDLLLCCDGELALQFSQCVPSNPVGITLSPDEAYCYVACADSDSIMQLSAATGRLLAMVRTHPYPVGICAADKLYCACMSGRCVTAFGLDSLLPVDTIALKGMPVGVCFANGRMLVPQMMCNEEWEGCLSPLVAPDAPSADSGRLDMPPGRLCVIRDGYLLAENGGERLKKLDGELRQIAQISLDGSIEGMTFDEEKDLAYISLSENHIIALDCVKMKEKAKLYVGLEPAGIALF